MLEQQSGELTYEDDYDENEDEYGENGGVYGSTPLSPCPYDALSPGGSSPQQQQQQQRNLDLSAAEGVSAEAEANGAAQPS